MSRAHTARRKAKRQQARAAAEDASHRRSLRPRRVVTALPVLAIVAILAVTAILSFGAGGGNSSKQVQREVSALLAGIPQDGATLGSPKAPLTVWVFGDVECPTVRSFVELYLPSIIDEWVRPGLVKINYRSLQTDTQSEEIFFDQEIAALAAGRQDRMWHFFLTFVREQRDAQSEYVNNEFLSGIASQIPDLKRAQWNRDRGDARLAKRVALGMRRAHVEGLISTPALLLGGRSPTKREVELSLRRHIESLRAEEWGDLPTLGNPQGQWKLGQ